MPADHSAKRLDEISHLFLSSRKSNESVSGAAAEASFWLVITSRECNRALIAAGVAVNIAETFSQASDLIGSQAKDFIRDQNLQHSEISPEQQKKLFIMTYDELEADVIRICNKDSVVQRYGACNWQDIQPVIRDVVVDLRYRGDYIPETRKKIQKAIAENDLAEFTTAMLDENYWLNNIRVPRDRFKRRCDYIRNA